MHGCADGVAVIRVRRVFQIFSDLAAFASYEEMRDEWGVEADFEHAVVKFLELEVGELLGVLSFVELVK